MSKLGSYCDLVHDMGGLLALVGLLREQEQDAITAGIAALSALSASSRKCRDAITELHGTELLLHIAEEREEPLCSAALRCIGLLASDAQSASRMMAEQGALEALLRLVQFSDHSTLAMQVLLQVSQHDPKVWDTLVLNADVGSAIALLSLGSPQVQARACLTVVAQCEMDVTVLDTLRDHLSHITSLLKVSDALGGSKSESPFQEAASSVARLCILSPHDIRLELVRLGSLELIIELLLRERRLGRSTSATTQTCMLALRAILDVEAQELAELVVPKHAFWDVCTGLQKRVEGVGALTMVLDAHVKKEVAGEGERESDLVAGDACWLLSTLPNGVRCLIYRCIYTILYIKTV